MSNEDHSQTVEHLNIPHDSDALSKDRSEASQKSETLEPEKQKLKDAWWRLDKEISNEFNKDRFQALQGSEFLEQRVQTINETWQNLDKEFKELPLQERQRLWGTVEDSFGG